MDFVFSNSPQRTATMTRSMVWAALDEGHIIFEESSHFEDGSWRMTLQNPELTIPANPFVYGHTGTVAAVAGGAAPAGWHVAWDPQSFDALHWSQVYGDAMWNHASVQFMALEEALARWPDQGWHMRPCGADSGPKAFKGFFSDRGGLDKAWSESRQCRERAGTMRVAVSAARLPREEYRLAFMQGECVDASLYLTDGRLTLSRGAPAHVLDYATSVARNHPLPSTHCAVDVGVDADGSLGIIEFNSLHSSGLYTMDRTQVVRGITRTWA